MAACEGALLVVDSTQGVEAQTIANAYLALENNLTIIPVINKIDIASADPIRTALEIENTIGIDCTNAIHISAKTGAGVTEVLEAIVNRIEPPRGDLQKPLRCLVFDTYFDKFRGIVSFIRVVDGQVMQSIH
jgi:translation elongation factor EF-4